MAQRHLEQDDRDSGIGRNSLDDRLLPAGDEGHEPEPVQLEKARSKEKAPTNERADHQKGAGIINKHYEI